MTYAFDVFRHESRPALIMASSADDAQYRGRWLAAVPVAVAILMLVLSAVANAHATDELMRWGSECRSEVNHIYLPNESGLSDSRTKIFDACMANGVTLRAARRRGKDVFRSNR